MKQVVLTQNHKIVRVLEAIHTRGTMPTYVIRNCLDWREKGREGKWLGATTPQVLRICWIAHKRGFVGLAKSSYATMKVWHMTDAGRAFLTSEVQ